MFMIFKAFKELYEDAKNIKQKDPASRNIFEVNNFPFVEYQAKKNKPMLISVGAANEDEIDRMIATVRKVNNQPLCILHCVLEYPTPYDVP